MAVAVCGWIVRCSRRRWRLTKTRYVKCPLNNPATVNSTLITSHHRQAYSKSTFFIILRRLYVIVYWVSSVARDRRLNVWLTGLVVSALGIRARRWPGFDSRVTPLFHWVATLGKLFTDIASPVSQLQELEWCKQTQWVPTTVSVTISYMLLLTGS